MKTGFTQRIHNTIPETLAVEEHAVLRFQLEGENVERGVHIEHFLNKS